MKKALLGCILILSANAFAEKWDAANSPFNMNRVIRGQMITTFDDLPLAANLADNRYAWSESYWPSNKGGIAYRWNHPDPQPFKYRLHTKEELMKMSSNEIGMLSPAELYDISHADYNYNLTKKVLSRFHARDLWWEGICHGWAQAAANYPEPSPVTITNRDGIKVPFGASDVKALLAHHEAYNYGGIFGFVGKRCKIRGKVPGEEDPRDGSLPTPTADDFNSSDCKDVNAGAFHVTVSNLIGIHSRSFVADIDRMSDVWNQPIYGYSSTLRGEETVTPEQRAQGIERRIRVATKFIYGEELKFWTPQLEAEGNRNFVSKLPVTGTPNQKYLHKDYEYIIELNGMGQVVGGEWITGTRPDFLWIYDRSAKFNNKVMPMEGLNIIYRPIRR